MDLFLFVFDFITFIQMKQGKSKPEYKSKFPGASPNASDEV